MESHVSFAFDNHSDERLYLYDLGHAVREFTRRECLEEGGVDEDEGGLPERADQVLARWCVYGGLAADGAVDHCEERGRDLDEPDATHTVRV
jgi:hypothetical protein